MINDKEFWSRFSAEDIRSRKHRDGANGSCEIFSTVGCKDCLISRFTIEIAKEYPNLLTLASTCSGSDFSDEIVSRFHAWIGLESNGFEHPRGTILCLEDYHL